MTLTEFLLARITEDEADARQCISDGDDDSDGSWYSLAGTDNGTEAIRALVGRWHPARVLAEMAAKRAIVGEHLVVVNTLNAGLVCSSCWTEDAGSAGPGVWPCITLRLLAMPYLAHPDYRQEWSA